MYVNYPPATNATASHLSAGRYPSLEQQHSKRQALPTCKRPWTNAPTAAAAAAATGYG